MHSQNQQRLNTIYHFGTYIALPGLHCLSDFHNQFQIILLNHIPFQLIILAHNVDFIIAFPMCVLKNASLTGEPIDFDADPPTCCPDCENDWEYMKPRIQRQAIENHQMYKLQIGHLTGMVHFNNSVIVRLIENQNYMLNHVAQLESMVQKLKGQLDKKSIPKSLTLNEQDHSDKLINLIFKSKSYAYEMVLAQDFETQLYKEKNFNIYLKLVDSDSNFIRNCNPIPICLKTYTSNQLNPEPIESNKLGLPLIKGNTEAELYHGSTQFNKLHLREVTSYFENGWVYLVIYAKAPSFNYTSSKSEFDLEVTYSDIKPLVIREVCVRAKPKRKL